MESCGCQRGVFGSYGTNEGRDASKSVVTKEPLRLRCLFRGVYGFVWYKRRDIMVQMVVVNEPL
ncbi:hypothetical protein Hanom_Chr10g00887401 [Helianthus anomalus]